MLLILLVLLLAYPFFEAFHINVKEHTTALNGLPSNLRNLKIVFLSDIHQNLWDSQARTDKVIRMVNSLSPRPGAAGWRLCHGRGRRHRVF